jgi:4-amino-4-deoxy-L-arabinose transferase-like glycosyltransferase
MRRFLPTRPPRVRPLVAIALIAFVNCAVWALIVPYFQAPDEPVHVAYAVELAETGHPPRQDRGLPFSGEVGVLAGNMATFDMLQYGSQTRPPWNASAERAYRAQLARGGVSRTDGGGPTSASVHGPVYYAFPALAYRIFYGASFTDRMLAMRLASALLAALTVVFVYGTVRELVPRRTWAPTAAALLVAFQPEFGFIGGMVNTDVGVNLAAAVLVYLLIRALRRGLTPAVGVGIAAAFVLGALAKVTLTAYLPVGALAFAFLLWRRNFNIKAWAAMALTGGLLLGAWAVVAPLYHHQFVPAPGGGGSVGAPLGYGGTLSYIWQVFLPPLPFMHHDFAPGIHPIWDIYVIRAWGGFGWLDIVLPHPLFVAIAIAMVMTIVLALRGLWLERQAVRTHIPEILVLLAAAVCVMGSTHAAFARPNPYAGLLEQGRYLFPAITTAAVTAIAACFGLGRRLAPVGATVMVAAMMGLSGFAQLYVFSSYFT